MKDGIINIDSDGARAFGFTSDRYAADSYLWRKGDFIIVSFIETKNKGNGDLSRLFDRILKAGYGIKVSSPLGIMPDILSHKGFEQTIENDDMFGGVEIWVKSVGKEYINKI